MGLSRIIELQFPSGRVEIYLTFLSERLEPLFTTLDRGALECVFPMVLHARTQLYQRVE